MRLYESKILRQRNSKPLWSSEMKDYLSDTTKSFHTKNGKSFDISNDISEHHEPINPIA